jgi:hypothetical protein
MMTTALMGGIMSGRAAAVAHAPVAGRAGRSGGTLAAFGMALPYAVFYGVQAATMTDAIATRMLEALGAGTAIAQPVSRPLCVFPAAVSHRRLCAAALWGRSGLGRRLIGSVPAGPQCLKSSSPSLETMSPAYGDIVSKLASQRSWIGLDPCAFA